MNSVTFYGCTIYILYFIYIYISKSTSFIDSSKKMLKLKKKTQVLLGVVLFLIILIDWLNGDELILIPFNESKIEIEDGREKNDLYKFFYVIQEFSHYFDRSHFCEEKIPKYLMEQFKNDEKFKKVFSHHDYKEEDATNTFLDNCEYKNCFFTCNSKYLDIADAYLFHANYIKDLMKYTYKKLRSRRQSRQIWILWNNSSINMSEQLDYFKFNWSLSNPKNSEIWMHNYGRMLNLQINDTLITTKAILAEFSKRSNSATWFIEDCLNKKNIEFANEISNYFPLKVGGDCMKRINGKKVIYFEENMIFGRSSSCERDYMKQNKFYLAFDSVNCTDYIIEKFWHSLSLGMIPVVFQPPKAAYKRLVPEDSFIHAQDFDYNTKRLGEYLDKVSKDKELYLKHLNWKFTHKVYYIGDTSVLDEFKICQLCKKLNQETKSIYYNSYSSWIHHKCLNSSIP